MEELLTASKRQDICLYLALWSPLVHKILAARRSGKMLSPTLADSSKWLPTSSFWPLRHQKVKIPSHLLASVKEGGFGTKSTPVDATPYLS